jgi:hypothetical protein
MRYDQLFISNHIPWYYHLILFIIPFSAFYYDETDIQRIPWAVALFIHLYAWCAGA